jgi:hypothetical protein
MSLTCATAAVASRLAEAAHRGGITVAERAKPRARVAQRARV